MVAGTGLRERKRRAAVRRIQEVALDLFDERGFDSVSVEEIAAAADASPSSVYRYFGTKEGIVLADEFDALTDGELAALIDPRDLVGSVRAVVARFDPSGEGEPQGATLVGRRIRYFFDEPSVRRASYEVLAEAAERVAQVLIDDGALDPPVAHIASSALVFGYFAALEEWYRGSREQSIAQTFQQGLDALQRP